MHAHTYTHVLWCALVRDEGLAAEIRQHERTRAHTHTHTCCHVICRKLHTPHTQLSPLPLPLSPSVILVTSTPPTPNALSSLHALSLSPYVRLWCQTCPYQPQLPPARTPAGVRPACRLPWPFSWLPQREAGGRGGGRERGGGWQKRGVDKVLGLHTWISGFRSHFASARKRDTMDAIRLDAQLGAHLFP